jgi:signal transduction histidine kinase
LYLARRIIDRFEGAMTVESVLGRGSCFRVWIPLDPRPTMGNSWRQNEIAIGH